MKVQHLLIEHIQASGRNILSQRKEDWYTIVLCAGGSGVVNISGVEHVLGAQQMLIIYPYLTPQLHNGQKLQGLALHFNEQFFHLYTEHKDILYRLPILAMHVESYIARLPAKVYTELDNLLRSMLAERKSGNKFSQRILLSYVNIFLLKCSDAFKLGASALSKVDYTSLKITSQYRRLVMEQYKHQHSVRYYADRMHLTLNYLNSVIKLVTGHHAAFFIHNQLVMEAKRLLIHTNQSPKEVAFELGFKDHSYFTKYFRRYTGENPLAWFHANK